MVSGLYHRVIDYIRRPPVTVKPQVPVRDAVKLMFENSIGSIVVVDESGRPIGIFTERDLLRIVAQGRSLDEPIGDVMTRDPITIKGDEDIVKAALIMSERRIRHLPVVDENGVLLGVISIRDVVEAFRKIVVSEVAEKEMGMFTA